MLFIFQPYNLNLKANLTSNGEVCKIPYNFANQENYFCVNPPSSKCQTKPSETFADCSLGNYMQIFGTSNFYMAMDFNPLDLLNPVYYQLEFFFVINHYDCDKDLLRLKFYLLDEQLIIYETLFDSNETNSHSNDRWNFRKVCFMVVGGRYSIRLEIIADCIHGQGLTFFAIDNLIVGQLVVVDDPEKCLGSTMTMEFQTTEEGLKFYI